MLVLRLVLDDSQIGTQKADKFILTRGVSHEPRASAGDLYHLEGGLGMVEGEAFYNKLNFHGFYTR